MAGPRGRYGIGFDIGGTFSDFVLLDGQPDNIRLHKCLTSPQDPSVGTLAGLAELLAAAGIPLASVDECRADPYSGLPQTR